jgi:phage tail-like protein
MTASSDSRSRGIVKRAPVPDVQGLTLENARVVLTLAGFEFTRVHYVEDYAPEFTIVEQMPRSGLLVPRDTEIALHVSRRSLIDFLPRVFQQTEVEGGGTFLRGFLNIIQTMYDSYSLRIKRLHEVFDPRTTDPDFLPWLGSWLAISLNPDWSVLQRRKMLMAATQLFPDRGTAKAISEFVRIYVGSRVTVEENTWPFKGFRIGVHSTIGEDTVILPPMNLNHCFVVRLDKPVTRVPDEEIIKIHQIIQAQKPAHTSYFLAFSDEEESGIMGTFMAIGVAPPVGVEGSPDAPTFGFGIGIGIDGTIFESTGTTGLIATHDFDAPVQDPSAAGGEPIKKQPKIRVGSERGDGSDDEGGKTP